MNHMEKVETVEFLTEVKMNLKKRKLSIAWAALQIGMTAHHLGRVMNGHESLTEDVRSDLANLNTKLQSFEEVRAV